MVTSFEIQDAIMLAKSISQDEKNKNWLYILIFVIILNTPTSVVHLARFIFQMHKIYFNIRSPFYSNPKLTLLCPEVEAQLVSGHEII